MIIRVFRGEIEPGRIEDFEDLLRHTSAPDFRRHSGCVALQVARPLEPDDREYLVVTVWENLAALQDFTGEAYQKARIHEDEAPLLTRSFVHHYEDAEIPALTFSKRGGGKAVLSRARFQPPTPDVLVVTTSSMALAPTVAALRSDGLRVLIVSSSKAAVRLLDRWRPSVVVISADVTACRWLLHQMDEAQVPIVLLGDERALQLPPAVNAVQAGILAPADPAEVAAAVDIIIGRRPAPDLPKSIEAGAIRVDLEERIAYVEGEVAPLPPKEFVALVELALRPNRPVSAPALARTLWPDSSWTTADDVRRTIYRLRRLLGDHDRHPPLIRSRRGFGYVLEVEETA